MSTRLRFIAAVNPPSPLFEELNNDAHVTFVPLEYVWATGLDNSLTRTKSDVATGYTRFQEGDIVVPKITPTFQADRTTIASGLRGGVAAGTTELHVVRVHDGPDIRYIRYLMSTASFLQGGEAELIGVAGQKRVPDDWLRNMIVPILDIGRQRAIASYLDRETARIDALIEKKQRMIELEREVFWGTFSEILDAASQTMQPLRRVITSIIDGPFGSALTSSHYSDAGVRVVRLGNIGFAEFIDDDKAFIPRNYAHELRRHRILRGDLLIAGLGDSRNHVGRACVAPELGEAIVKADCYRAAVDPSKAMAEFMALFLSSPAGALQVSLAARGTTRSRINLDIARAILVPKVELEDQRRIVVTAKRHRATVNQMVEILTRQCDLLIERRQALITAAVTGQLEIPGEFT